MSEELPRVGDHSKYVLNLMREQERRKAIEVQKQIKEYEIQLEPLKLERKRVEGEERRKTIAEEMKLYQHKAQFACKRYEDQLTQQPRIHDMRRTEEMEGKAKLQKVAEESINQIFGPTVSTVGYSLLIFALFVRSYYALKTTYKASLHIFHYLEPRFMKPSLVQETSRFTVNSFVRHPIKTISKFYERPEDLMKGIILKPTLEQRLRVFAKSTRHARDTGDYFRNTLFFGPPGTGKLLFAKSLAKHSGLDFALMDGNSVALLGKEAVDEVQKVFKWVHTSRKGVVLYVDQAETFLGKRNTEEETRAALNAFLRRTRQRSNKFVLILSSSYPERFSPAILKLLPENVEFKIPSYEERERLVRHYLQEFLEPVVSKSGLFNVEELDYDKKFAEIADQTDGFSCEDIFRLCLDLQDKAVQSGRVLTDQMINEVVKAAIQHKQKIATREAKFSREMPTIKARGTAGQQGASNPDDSRA